MPPIKDAATTKRCAHPRFVNFGCSVEQKSASLYAAAHFSLCEATNGRRRVSSFMAVFFCSCSQQPGPGLFSPCVWRSGFSHIIQCIACVTPVCERDFFNAPPFACISLLSAQQPASVLWVLCVCASEPLYKYRGWKNIHHQHQTMFERLLWKMSSAVQRPAATSGGDEKSAFKIWINICGDITEDGAKVGKRPRSLEAATVLIIFKWEDVCVWRRRRESAGIALSFAFVFVSGCCPLEKREKFLWRCVRVWADVTKNRRFDLMRETRYFSHLCCQNTLFQSPRLTRWQRNWQDGVSSTHPYLYSNELHTPLMEREKTRVEIGQ